MASLLFSRVPPCSPDLRPDLNTSSIKGFSREKVIVFDLGNLGNGKDRTPPKIKDFLVPCS